MPVKTYTEDEQTIHLATLEPSMVYILDKMKVKRMMQTHLAASGVHTLSRFAALGDDIAEVKKVLKEDLNLDSAEGLAVRMEIADVTAAWKQAVAQFDEEAERCAKARASEQIMSVPVADHKLLKKSFEKIHGELALCETPGRYFLGQKIDQATQDELVPEKLIEVCSKQENESDVWTPCFGQDGRIVSKKGAPVTRPKPKDAEELRNRHRLIGAAWVMVHLQHANRPWLKDMKVKDWENVTDYVVGEKVARYQIKQEGGTWSPQPSWFIVLHYEHEIRKKAYELVGEGKHMVEALKLAMACTDTRQLHFTMPLQLEITKNAAAQLSGKNQYGGKGKHDQGAKAIQDAFAPTKGVNKGNKGKDKGGNKGKKEKSDKYKPKSVTPGPEKRRICYAFNNNANCDGSCGMAHVCQICLESDHGRLGCKKVKKA